jgi:exonuclease SbcD
MATFSFIHAADIHLDSPLHRLGRFGEETADTLRTATRGALINLVDMAIEESVAFVLIAGDVYDGDWDDVRTGLFMVQEMQRLREHGIPVFMIHGNHDAVTKMTNNVPFPDNVVVFSHRNAETHRLDSIHVAIHGQSFARQAVTQNLARAYPSAIPNYFNIGVLHTALEGREGHETYAPCTVADLTARDYDYWALGHIHTREIVCHSPLIVFPGNPQGRSIRETGERGGMLVTVEHSGAGGPNVVADFKPLDVARWLRLEVDASSVGKAEDLQELVRERLARIQEEHEGKTLVLRLDIQGHSRWSDDWVGNQQRWDLALRSIALQEGAHLIIDKIRFQTTSPADQPLGGVDDDAIAAIEQAVREYMTDPVLTEDLATELSELANKLPAELLKGDEPFVITDKAFLASILEEVGPALRVRLTADRSTD